MYRGYQTKSYEINHTPIKGLPHIDVQMTKYMYKQIGEYCNRLFDINFNMKYGK